MRVSVLLSLPFFDMTSVLKASLDFPGHQTDDLRTDPFHGCDFQACAQTSPFPRGFKLTCIKLHLPCFCPLTQIFEVILEFLFIGNILLKSSTNKEISWSSPFSGLLMKISIKMIQSTPCIVLQHDLSLFQKWLVRFV